MPDRPQDLEARRISEEAADWLVCLRGGPVGLDGRRRYVRWLKQSPAHVHAMLELFYLDDLLRHSGLHRTPPAPEPAKPPQTSNVVDLMPRQVRREPSAELPQLLMWRHWRLIASVSELEEHRNRSR